VLKASIEWLGQDLLTSSLEDTTAAEKVDRARSVLKEIAKSAIDKSFEEHGIQAIIAPTDSSISSLASAAGKRLSSVLLF
jgi:ABC-type phosphate/phosphonate transport system substrate-binding protein